MTVRYSNDRVLEDVEHRVGRPPAVGATTRGTGSSVAASAAVAGPGGTHYIVN
jgi:hypothetical protein